MAFLIEAFEVAKQYSLPILLILLAAHLAYTRYRPGLRDIPGPVLASITDFWRLVHSWSGKSHLDYLLHRQYNSSLIRIGPNTVAVADPEAIRIIYGFKPVFLKSQLYTTQSQINQDGCFVENLASMIDEEKHNRLLRPVAGAYAMSTLVDFEPLVDSTSKEFLRQMEDRFVDPGKECPLATWLQFYAFDVIGELTFSKRIGFLDAGADVDNLMQATGNFMDYTGIVGQIPALDLYFRIKNPILHRLRPTSNILSFTLKQIHEHVSYSDTPRPDFLTRFLQAQKKHPDIITETLVEDYANTNVAGGSDTTAIILRALIYELLVQPAIYDRFFAEVKATLEARNEQSSYDKPIAWAEGLKMTYFQVCIKEILRYHPATAQMMPRLVPKGGYEICGKYLPGGTVVGCNAWTVHRDKELYGPDADIFRPERWLEAAPEQARKMENAILTFGAGTRSCVGKHIAMLEITKFVPEFFRRFEIQLVDPKRYKAYSTWLVVQSGLDVNLKRRSLESLKE